MLQLKTKWGLYLLQNAIRIDFYRVKEKNWEVLIAIDGNKHLLQSFEEDMDSIAFCSYVRNTIFDIFDEYDPKLVKKIDLDELCEKAFNAVINGEDI